MLRVLKAFRINHNNNQINNSKTAKILRNPSFHFHKMQPIIIKPILKIGWKKALKNIMLEKDKLTNSTEGTKQISIIMKTIRKKGPWKGGKITIIPIIIQRWGRATDSTKVKLLRLWRKRRRDLLIYLNQNSKPNCAKIIDLMESANLENNAHLHMEWKNLLLNSRSKRLRSLARCITSLDSVPLDLDVNIFTMKWS